ncbi:MAG: hypothetical protein GYB35_15560 [Algicola sp.]|nr:hypothetical protein [Algicola sp.]
MKKAFVWILLVFIVVSCQVSNDAPYQSFSVSDYDFIPENYQASGTILKFKTQDNEEVLIETNSYMLKKEFESGISFAQSSNSESFYYDDLWISLKLLNVSSQSVDGYDYCDRIKIHIRKVRDGSLSTQIDLPYYNGTSCGGSSFRGFSLYENLIQMNVNNATYEKVKILVPNDYFTFYDGSQIDKVYYDFDKGIIGFDDTEQNLEFRLTSQ